MPAGSTHDRITLWTVPVVTGVAGWVGGGADAALAVGAAYLFSGLMFSGDLDIHSRQYQRWTLMRWLWIPYRHLFRHRSFWSHGPLVGTTLRLIYIGLWLLALAGIGLAAGSMLGWWRWDPLHWLTLSGQWARQHRESLTGALIGMELGSLSHSLSDVSLSAWKRTWNKRTWNKRTSSKRIGNKRQEK